MAYPRVYSSLTGEWTELFQEAVSIETVGGIEVSSPLNNDILRYNTSSTAFVNTSIENLLSGKNISTSTLTTSGVANLNSASVVNNASVGGNLVVGSSLTVNGVLITGASSSATVTTEQIQDAAAPLFDHAFHTNITATYDDANNRILLSASASSGSVTLTTEEIQDAAAPLLNHAFHNNITATYDDANNRIILSGSASSGSASISSEDVQDIVGPMFAHSNHANASATYNDGTGQVLISVANQTGVSSQTNFYDVVRDYGAIAGETNSATKIQNALNAARDAGTGIVYIPAGTYNVESTLQIFSGTTLYLTPKTVIFRQFATSPLLANGQYGASYSGYNGQSNIRIIGGIWESRGQAYPIQPAMGMSIGHGTDIIIKDLTISNIGGYHAIEVNSSKNVRIENCRFTGYVDTGNRGYSEAIQIDLAKGSAYFGWFGAYDETTCEDVIIDGCFFGTSGTAGTTAWPTGIGTHSYTSGYYHTNTKIINNHFKGLTEFAIRTYVMYKNLIIANNTIESCYAGIGIGIDGNADHTTTTQPAPQTSYNINITGNIIDNSGNSGAWGIGVWNADGLIIQSNQIKNIIRSGSNLADGIFVSTTSDALISDNRIENVSMDGIDVRTNSSAVMVSNNIIKDASQLTSNTYNYIYFNDNVSNSSIIANRGFKQNSNTGSYGIRITATCSGMRAFGNWFSGTTTTLANAYTDDSAGSTSTANE
jgi:hypothetical protein